MSFRSASQWVRFLPSDQRKKASRRKSAGEKPAGLDESDRFRLIRICGSGCGFDRCGETRPRYLTVCGLRKTIFLPHSFYVRLKRVKPLSQKCRDTPGETRLAPRLTSRWPDATAGVHLRRQKLAIGHHFHQPRMDPFVMQV